MNTAFEIVFAISRPVLQQANVAFLIGLALSALACAACDERAAQHDAAPPIVTPGLEVTSEAEVMAVRADIETVKAALAASLPTSDWKQVMLQNGRIDPGARPGFLLQLPSHAWTLVLQLGGRWGIRDVAPTLAKKLRTAIVVYRKESAGLKAEELQVWQAEEEVRSHVRLGDVVHGYPSIRATDFNAVTRAVVEEQSLYLPACSDGDPEKIAALMKRHPTARAHAFLFYGTSGRIMPPSTWPTLPR